MKKTNAQNMYSNSSSQHGNTNRNGKVIVTQQEGIIQNNLNNIMQTYNSSGLNRLNSEKKSNSSKVRLNNNSQNRAIKNSSKNTQKNYVSA